MNRMALVYLRTNSPLVTWYENQYSEEEHRFNASCVDIYNVSFTSFYRFMKCFNQLIYFMLFTFVSIIYAILCKMP